VLIAEAAELASKSLTYGLYVRSTRHGQSKTTFSALHQPREFFFRQCAIGIALLIGERSQHESVFHGWPMSK
jgi:hypothetical protein